MDAVKLLVTVAGICVFRVTVPEIVCFLFFFLLLMTEFSTVFFVPSIVVAVFAATHIFPVVLLPTGSACVSVCRAFAWWVG